MALRDVLRSVAARGAILEPGKFRVIGDRVVFVRERTRDNRLRGILVSDRSDPRRPFFVLAEEGSFVVDESETVIRLHLEHGDVHVEPESAGEDRYQRISFERFDYAFDASAMLESSSRELRPSDMTDTQLRPVLARAAAGDPLTDLRERAPREYALQLHRRSVLPFAPILFALVAVPLGRIARAALSTGAMLCVAIAFSYYAILSLAQLLARNAAVPPALALWLPNLAFALLAFRCCSAPNFRRELMTLAAAGFVRRSTTYGVVDLPRRSGARARRDRPLRERLRATRIRGCARSGRAPTRVLATGRTERAVLRWLRHGGLLGQWLGGVFVGVMRVRRELVVNAALRVAGAPVRCRCSALRDACSAHSTRSSMQRCWKRRRGTASPSHSAPDRARARRVRGGRGCRAALSRRRGSSRRSAPREPAAARPADAAEVLVVDLDRARRRAAAGRAASARDRRLDRSLVKRGVTARVGARGVARFFAAYCGGDRAARALIAGFARERRRLRRMRSAIASCPRSGLPGRPGCV